MNTSHQIHKFRSRFIASLFLASLGLFVFFLGRWVGLKEVTSRYFTLENGVLYTEKDVGLPINDFKSVSKIFHSIHINGVEVNGRIISVSVADVVEIVAAINRIDNVEPILMISVLSESHVEVTTGVVDGPLAGGGKIYSLKKVNGGWIIDFDETSYWVS